MAVRETPLDPFANGSLWIKRVPLRFFGLQIGARMTVVRLGDGGLCTRPTTADDKTRPAVDELSPVQFIVAPNRLHQMWVADGPPLAAKPAQDSLGNIHRSLCGP